MWKGKYILLMAFLNLKETTPSHSTRADPDFLPRWWKKHDTNVHQAQFSIL